MLAVAPRVSYTVSNESGAKLHKGILIPLQEIVIGALAESRDSRLGVVATTT